MHIIAMLFIGLIVGLLARALHPGRDPMGILMTCLLGIGGSVVAGYLGHSLGFYRQGEPVGLIASTIGAILILVVYHLITRQRRTWA